MITSRISAELLNTIENVTHRQQKLSFNQFVGIHIAFQQSFIFTVMRIMSSMEVLNGKIEADTNLPDKKCFFMRPFQ